MKKIITLLLGTILMLITHAEEEKPEATLISLDVISIKVKALLNYGYPAAKIKYFCGGMQNWKTLGLTTISL